MNKPRKGIKHMMYSDFNAWRNETNRIIENLKNATPQKFMEDWQAQNNISQLKHELNNAKINTSITTTDYNFGHDEKERLIFTVKQAARALTNSYKLNWFQYTKNSIKYKIAERYIFKEIEKRANKGLDWIEFSELKWPFDKFPELVERLQFLGFQKILSSNYCVHCFSWKEEGITTLKY